jgi:hypothetical protein
MFRRYMHLAPNLYIAILIAMAIGCTSGISIFEFNFCPPCVQYGLLVHK